MPIDVAENRKEPSHRHWCDVAGHYYSCGEECECFCGLPMNDYDHADCPVELRPCPEHESQQNQPIPAGPLPEGVVEIKFPDDWEPGNQPRCECGCTEIDAAEVVGWCFHCSHVYANYSPEIQDRHLAYDCPGAPSELKQAALSRLGRRAERRRQ